MTIATPQEHYEALLNEVYPWMMGPFDVKAEQQQAILTRLGLAPRGCRRALDLGCGPGYQSVALARLGFEVTGVDTSESMLTAMRQETSSLPVRGVLGDMQQLRELAPGPWEVVVCMGDTLTHLQSLDEVRRLVAAVAGQMERGGTFVVGYRDMSTLPQGLDRIIPVKADAERVSLCFLEEEGPESYLAYDIVHTREGEHWRFAKGCYRKLRLGADWLAAELAERGLAVRHREIDRGMTRLVAGK
jgi:SAM-dependent methyltransferase